MFHLCIMVALGQSFNVAIYSGVITSHFDPEPFLT
jgi:hypothetical protein